MSNHSFSVQIKQLLESEKYDEVANCARPIAESGDAEAQFLLGYLYLTSADVDWSASEKWLRAAAEQNHACAIYYLSLVHNEQSSCGEEVWFGPPDTIEGQEMLRKAAELGCPDAQRDLGCELSLGEIGGNFFQKDETEGRKWYLEAAKQGHVDAQYNVALMFLAGEGGEVDVVQGLHWLEQSALSEDCNSSSESSAVALADIYENGYHGVSRDAEKAESMRCRAKELDQAYRDKYGI